MPPLSGRLPRPGARATGPSRIDASHVHRHLYDAVVIDDLLGRQWTVFRFIQYAGHIVGTLLGLWRLARIGRERQMATSAATVERFPVTVRSSAILAVGVLVGSAVGAAWVLSDRSGSATDILRIASINFGFLAATSSLLQLTRTPRVTSPQLPTSA